MIQREGESPGAGGFQSAERLTSAGGGTLTPVLATMSDTSTRRPVVGVDASGQWPGAGDNDPGAEFVRYLYLAPQDGQPEDIVNPVHPASEARR
jgi:hypothetical protein